MNEQESQERLNSIRTECWNKALYSLAVYYILKIKATNLERIMNINKVTGIIVPFLIGSIATTYSDKPELLKYFILVTILQFLLSTYLTVSNKENNYSTYVTNCSSSITRTRATCRSN